MWNVVSDYIEYCRYNVDTIDVSNVDGKYNISYFHSSQTTDVSSIHVKFKSGFLKDASVTGTLHCIAIGNLLYSTGLVQHCEELIASWCLFAIQEFWCRWSQE